MDDTYCNTPVEPGSWESYIKTYFCGIGSVVGVVTGTGESVATHTEDTVATLSLGAQGVANNVVDTYGAAVGGAQDILLGWSTAADDAAKGLNPLNLAGLGFGAVLAVTGVGVVGAVAADWLLADGAGTRALVAFVKNKRGKR